MNRLRLLLIVLVSVTLTGCVLPPFNRQSSPDRSTPESPGPTDPGYTDDVLKRVQRVLDRTGTDQMVSLRAGDIVEVGVTNNGRLYRYGENDSDPTPSADDGQARPFTLDEINLPALIDTSLEINSDCVDPTWTVTAVAYGLRTIQLQCDFAVRETTWIDGSIIKVENDNPKTAMDAASRLPDDAPGMAYQMTVSNNSQVGDTISVEYADDKLGAVEVRLNNDPNRLVTTVVYPPSTLMPFPVADVPIDKVVECGQQMASEAKMSWWFVNIRWVPYKKAVVLKWDTTGAWVNQGPETDINCQPLP